MKNKICLLLCALLLLSCVPGLAGCSAAEQRPETPPTVASPAEPETESEAASAEQSPGPAYPGPPDSKSGLRRTEEQMEAMKDFLTAHQAEMEEIVDVMMEYSSRETENEYTTFCYSVTWQKLHQLHTVIKEGVRGPGPREVGVFTEHPIITKLQALGEEPVFDFAETDFSHASSAWECRSHVAGLESFARPPANEIACRDDRRIVLVPAQGRCPANDAEGLDRHIAADLGIIRKELGDNPQTFSL